MSKTNATAPPLAPLAEPVIVSEFWANRRGEAVRVQLREYEGRQIIDVRRHFTNAAGNLQATKKGLALTVIRLPELAAAINKALAKAHELGLIDDTKGRGHE